MNSHINNIIIRVYGIVINRNQEVLLSDEYQMNMYMSKFPGGGLLPGEGTIECLKREIKEELNCNCEIVKHLYTTEFFQKALFYENSQLISIYYQVAIRGIENLNVSFKKFDFDNPPRNGMQSFRWKSISELSVNDLTFPIDQKLVFLLKKMY